MLHLVEGKFSISIVHSQIMSRYYFWDTLYDQIWTEIALYTHEESTDPFCSTLWKGIFLAINFWLAFHEYLLLRVKLCVPVSTYVS